MPALDLASGRLLLETPGQLFLSPNGHGGTVTGLAESGLLVRLRKRGIQHVYYFQVDNPLVRLDDTLFLGRHIHDRADVSSKVIVKERPEEKLGLFVLVDGKLTIIEYSDIPDVLSRAADERGRLRLWAGNPAIHLFAVDFLERITCEQHGLPWHVAKKKVPHLDAAGRQVQPERENALKFEMFIFDVLPQAQRWTVLPIERRREFEPLKNATGKESPESVQQALTDLAADWLQGAGVNVPRDAASRSAYPLEISPLFALDAEELRKKISPAMRVDKAIYFE
jgi:UDP-N-acetylglucosamine/UDP-N-acetylgalactosamine diphosphorylase